MKAGNRGFHPRGLQFVNR